MTRSSQVCVRMKKEKERLTIKFCACKAAIPSSDILIRAKYNCGLCLYTDDGATCDAYIYESGYTVSYTLTRRILSDSLLQPKTSVVLF